MKKNLFFICLLLPATFLSAQISVSKPIGKYDDKYKVGFGAYLSYNHPVSDAADITGELGYTKFQAGYIGSTLGSVSLKFGYRYTLNQTGFGFYLHPQVGYSVFGEDNDSYHAPAVAGGIGYLFDIGGTQFDAGLVIEATKAKDFSLTFVSFRLAYGLFLLGRNNRE